MNSALKEYLQSRDYHAITRQCVEWIREWFSQNGPNSPAVIGISGGKDSSVVAALCKEALGRDRVFGVMMPDHIQPDINVSRQLIQFLDIPFTEINVGPAVSAVKESVAESGIEATSRMSINIPPRIRMTTLMPYPSAWTEEYPITGTAPRNIPAIPLCSVMLPGTSPRLQI